MTLQEQFNIYLKDLAIDVDSLAQEVTGNQHAFNVFANYNDETYLVTLLFYKDADSVDLIVKHPSEDLCNDRLKILEYINALNINSLGIAYFLDSDGLYGRTHLMTDNFEDVILVMNSLIERVGTAFSNYSIGHLSTDLIH